MKKSTAIIFSFICLILLVSIVYVNILVNYLPLNGKDTKTLSNQYPNLFVPAGLTFSIWGVIYILLTIFSIYNIVKAINDPEFIKRTLNIIISFAITCLLNIAWIFAWHYENLILSVLIMVAFLVTLIYMFVNQRKLQKNEKLSLLYTVPVEFYLGWISVATIANITALLVYFNWFGFGISANVWAMIMIVIGGVLGILMLIKHNSIAYSIVIIWAYTGIIIKRISSEPVYKEIIITASIMIALILIATIRSILILKTKAK